MSVNPPPLAVGYVLKRYPRFSETFVVNEILALEAAGTSIEIFALGPVDETHFQEAISRVKAPVRRIRHHFNNAELYWQLFQRSYENLPGFRKNIALAAEHDVLIVGQALVLAAKALASGLQHLHAHFGTQAATVARLAAAFAQINYSFTAHAKDIYHEYTEPVHLDRKIDDAAFTVTVSDYNLAWLREHFGARGHNSYRIYNGLDLGNFPYQAPNEVSTHIASVGRLVEKKGFPLLIDAMAILRDRGVDCRCTLVGDGPLRKKLAAQIEALQLQDRVEMVGVKTQPQVIRLLQDAALMAAPCVISKDGDRDGLPTILIEAMALGVPCVSTRVVGIPELVRDQQTGLCVEPDSPAALADAMEYLLKHPKERVRLAENARQLVEQEYDVHQNTRRLKALFAKSIAEVEARSTESADASTLAGKPPAVGTGAQAVVPAAAVPSGALNGAAVPGASPSSTSTSA